MHSQAQSRTCRPVTPVFAFSPCHSHPTSCCSAAEIMAVLFFHTMRYKAQDPRNPHNDRFVLSKVRALAARGLWLGVHPHSLCPSPGPGSLASAFRGRLSPLHLHRSTPDPVSHVRRPGTSPFACTGCPSVPYSQLDPAVKEQELGLASHSSAEPMDLSKALNTRNEEGDNGSAECPAWALAGRLHLV